MFNKGTILAKLNKDIDLMGLKLLNKYITKIADSSRSLILQQVAKFLRNVNYSKN